MCWHSVVSFCFAYMQKLLVAVLPYMQARCQRQMQCRDWACCSLKTGSHRFTKLTACLAAQVLQTLLPFLRNSTAANMALSAGISPIAKGITILQNALTGLA